MIDHYNAFISYKHAELDTKIATLVQRELEHFHIPLKIRKKTGIKRINRIFRDQDELPITSNLSDDISFALEHADYLIVICSTSTRLSMWVPREIEYFLRNHTRHQILTVLADGEDPYECLPDILLHEEREVADENGAKHTVSVSLEPLSCDFRIPMSRVKKEEIPRLAASLIGCSYDELMRRRRQYQVRRLALGFSAVTGIALAFAGYMFYSRSQINEAYRESLRNQSRYLANESSQFLDNEQRITAMQLALAALPSENDPDRPVTPEAVRALTNATNAYVGLHGSNITSVWNYTSPNQIKSFHVSPEKTTLAACDYSDVVTIWDIETHEEIKRFTNIEETIRGMEYLNDDILLVWSSNCASAYNTSNGSLAWRINASSDSSFTAAFDRTDGDNAILLHSSGEIFCLDAYSGDIINHLFAPTEHEDSGLTYSRVAVSPNGKFFALVGVIDYSNYFVTILDTSTGIVSDPYVLTNSVTDLVWGDDSHCLVAVYDINGYGSISMYNSTILQTDINDILCFDASGNLLWSKEFQSNAVSYDTSFLALPDTGTVSFHCGNIASIMDLDNGEDIYRFNANSSIVDSSDRDGDGFPLFITRDGGVAIPATYITDDALNVTYCLSDDLVMAEVCGSIYVCKSGAYEILQYSTGVMDDDWTSFDEDVSLRNINSEKSCIGEGYLAIVTDEDPTSLVTPYAGNASSNSCAVLSIFDLDERELITQIPLDPETGLVTYKCNLLGFYDGMLYISESHYLPDGSFDYACRLYIIDPEDGSFTSEDAFIASASLAEAASFSDGILTYIDNPEYGVYRLNTYNTVNEKRDSYPLEAKYCIPAFAPIISKDRSLIFYSDKEPACYLYNTNNEEVIQTEIPEDFGKVSAACFSEDSNYLILTNEQQILVLDREGCLVSSISCHGSQPHGFYCYQTQDSDPVLLVAYNNASLYRCDLLSGETIGESEISVYATTGYNTIFKIDEENRLLYLQIGDIMDVVDLDTWYEMACFQQCLGHDDANDIFPTYSYSTYNECGVGYFNHYSVEDLIEKAAAQLQGATLSDELRSRYGLD